MKKLLYILIISLSIAPVLSGQTIFKINQYNIYYNRSLMPVATLFTNHQISPRLSVTSYFYINAVAGTGWGEGLAGVTWTPVPGISVGLLGGLQSNEPQPFRFSPIVLLNKNRFSFFGAFEFGGARYRWDCMGFYAAGPFRLGGELIRYYGMYAAGPRAEFTFLKRQPVTLFYSALWDWQGSKLASMFGIYSAFGGNSTRNSQQIKN
jgi:hypothetical protein